MRRVTVAFALFLTIVCGEALASNRSVAAQRMTAQLFAEYNGPEPGQEGFKYAYPWSRQCTENPNTHAFEVHCQLEMKEGPDAVGSIRWVPARLLVACHRSHCSGQVDAIYNPPGAEEGAFGPQEWRVVLVDHAVFRGRKGTYHETGWSPS
jgi:hypothetical protein